MFVSCAETWFEELFSPCCWPTGRQNEGWDPAKSNGLDLVLFVFTLHYCLQDTGSWIVSCVSDLTQLSFFDVQPLVFNTQTHPNKCGTFVVRELCPVFSAGSCVTGQLARFPFQFVGIMQLLDKKLGEV